MRCPRIWVLLLLAALAATAEASPAARRALQQAVLSMAQKPFVSGEDRPRSDGRFEASLISREVAVLNRFVPRWGEAAALHSEDPNHPHSIAEHGMRALYHYARTEHANSIRHDRDRYFLACLTVMLHDMGKLDSPRDAAGRQKKDPGHPARCAAYARRHAARMGLTRSEIEWMALMLHHHRDMGEIQRDIREPDRLAPAQKEAKIADLARSAKTRSNLEFLAALNIADVRGINATAYHDWRLEELLPRAMALVIAKLPK